MAKPSSSLMTGASHRTSGLEPNIAAVLSYLVMVPPITPVIMLLLEKEDRYVRFHALQGLLLGVLRDLLSLDIPSHPGIPGEVSQSADCRG